MLDDLDQTLRALLKKELPPELISPQSGTPVTFSFIAPDAQFPPSAVTLPVVDLFLYDVRENRELRSNERPVQRQDNGPATYQRWPVRVDCSYLITAWPGDATSAQDEHRLLGEVMQALLRYTLLPADVLQGSLQEQEPPPRAMSLQPGHLQSVGEFWQALGGKPRAALHYTVTISVDALQPDEAVPVVTETKLNLKQLEQKG